MALTKCIKCGHNISTTASICPNCGATSIKKKNTTFVLIILILVIVFVGLPILGYIKRSTDQYVNRQVRTSSTSDIQTQTLHKELQYLSDIPEIAWFEIEGNNVYVGFNTLPEDWEMIIKGAALRGNQAINFGCHVWAVDAQKKGWRPGDSSFFGEFSARYGKIE
jgi:predicted nucleic acid-binding Zn ribbon protein